MKWKKTSREDKISMFLLVLAVLFLCLSIVFNTNIDDSVSMFTAGVSVSCLIFALLFPILCNFCNKELKK